ncbi:MAG TPA: multidrug effflux MFS transporter [Bauldia sp.]|nr:multidrug effflux MFS transporter [Bauldia sp.]
MAFRSSAIGRIEFVALMAAINMINSAAIDVMLPALPNMGAAFGVTNENDRSLVLTVFAIGLGLPQLVFGPLVDRYGRRVPLLLGLALYSLASLAAPLAPTFPALLALRFLQGMGSAASAVAAQAAIRDRYAGREMAEVMSMIWSVFMISPILAPGVGQLILLTGSWQIIFGFMGLVGVVFALWTYFRLPESLPAGQRRPLTLAAIGGGFAAVIGNRMSLFYALASTFLFGAVLGMVNSSQPIYVGVYGLGPLFPLAFAVAPIVSAVAFFINARLVATFGMRRLSHASMVAFVVAVAVWLAIDVVAGMPLWVFILFMGIAMLALGLGWGNVPALMMEPLGEVAGTASAVFGSLSTVGAAALGYAVAQTFDGTPTPFIASLLVFGIIVVALFAAAEGGRLFGGRPVGVSVDAP